MPLGDNQIGDFAFPRVKKQRNSKGMPWNLTLELEAGNLSTDVNQRQSQAKAMFSRRVDRHPEKDLQPRTEDWLIKIIISYQN